MPRFQTERDILEIVEKFENGKFERREWGHAEHLTVGFYYIWNNDYETALQMMRDGIFNLLKSFQVDFTKEMPYHETLTVFWLQTIDDFKTSRGDNSPVEICNELIENFDKNYPFKFYSREHLFSDRARKEFVASDLQRFE